MSIKTAVELKECPLCKGEKITIGPNDCTSWAISCECGIRLIERMPSIYTKEQDKTIKKIKKELKLDWMKAIGVLHMLSLEEKWNRR